MTQQQRRDAGGTGLSRRSVLATLGGTALAGLAGCTEASDGGDGSGASTPTTQGTATGGGEESLTIGAALSLSQGWEAYGNTMLRAIEIGADRIEERGLADDVSVVVRDTEVDPQTAQDRTEELIQREGADVIVGPVSSANRIAMAPLLEENEVPGLYPVEYEGSVAEDYCNPWLFKTAEVPSQQIEPFVPWLVEKYGSSFYLLGSDYVWPQEMNATTTSAVEAAGGEVLNEEYVSIGETGFSSILPRIEEADPDVLFMTLTGPSVPAIQKQAQNFGLRDQWTEVGVSHGQGLLAGAPAEAVEGVVSCHSYMENLDTERNQAFVEEFRARDDSTPITFLTGTARVATRLLEAAVAEQDAVAPAAIREGLRGVSAETVAGEVSMDVDQQATLPTRASRVNGDREHVPVEEFEAVEPDEACDTT